MRKILYLLIALTAMAAFIAFLEIDIWWIRVFDFPRLQILIVALILLFVLVFFSEKKLSYFLFLSLVVIVIVLQMYLIFPFTPFAEVEVHPAKDDSDNSSITIFISNVLMTNRGDRQLKKLIREYEPELILLTETDTWWAEHLTELDSVYPFSLKVPLPNTYGMLFYSKLKLYQPKIRYLVQKDIPSVHAFVELKTGEVVEFFGLHPRPPIPTENYESDERDAEVLIAGREVAKSNYPAILAGDLNDVAWSHSTKLFKEISETLDPRVGRGLFNTFNAHWFFVRWPLDHVFHTEHFFLMNLQRVNENFGSDHFPIFIKLKLDPSADVFNHPPNAEIEEINKANETIEEALEENN